MSSTVTVTVLTPGTGTGLRGVYFNNTTLKGNGAARTAVWMMARMRRRRLRRLLRAGAER